MPKKTVDEELLKSKDRFTPDEAVALWYGSREFEDPADYGLESYFPKGVREKYLTPEEIEAEKTNPTVPTAREVFEHWRRYEAILTRDAQQCMQAEQGLRQQILDAIDDGELAIGNTGKIKGVHLARWAKEARNEVPPFLERFDLTRVQENTIAPVPATSEAYYSPDLRLAIQAAELFWKDFDPAHPRRIKATSNPIIRWLQGETVDDYAPNLTPVDITVARRIDRIIRPPEARFGGLVETTAD